MINQPQQLENINDYRTANLFLSHSVEQMIIQALNAKQRCLQNILKILQEYECHILYLILHAKIFRTKNYRTGEKQ